MNDIKKIGMLTPSSNTILEPVTTAIISGIPNVSAHFSRFKVTEISLKSDALRQFQFEPMLQAARLLADAEVDVIAWNGTSAGWLGFDVDEVLCQKIKEETGIQATSSVLALNEVFDRYGIKNFGLVTPYTQDINEKIIENYDGIGLNCLSQQHCGIFVNKEFSRVSSGAIQEMVDRTAVPGVEAITTLCTNLRAAPLVEELERKYNLPILDSISVVVWKSLKMIGISPEVVNGWGTLFHSDQLQNERSNSFRT